MPNIIKISNKVHPVKFSKTIISPKVKLFDQVKIYNSLSKKKEIIKPLKDKKINIFVCGPTVYDFSHLGHARTSIIFDFFVKYLKFLGFKVFYLQNITDVDDKIILRAREKGVLPKDLTDSFFKEYLKDMRNLGIDSVDKYAKATRYIKEIISQVKRLLDKGYAYKLEDGIYYDISKFKDYGKLARRTVLDAEDGTSRIDYSKNKKNRGDFCLWKFAEKDASSTDKISWPANFGPNSKGIEDSRQSRDRGRPGWHIEDTAITEKFFGPQYDIHGGGRDLIFPHHEAEIAQMEAISGKKPLVKYWMHIGFLTTNGQKMSKSLNNFIVINDFLKRHSYRHLRFWVAKNLWKSPMNYSESAMIEVKSSLEKVEEFLCKILNSKSQIQNKSKIKKSEIQNLLKKLKKDFYGNLADDFNTPKSIADIFNFIKETNKLLDNGLINNKDSAEIYGFFEEINKIFDFIDFKSLKKSDIPKEVNLLLKEREKYRKSSNWQKSDELRKKIEKYGFLVQDTKEGSVLKRIYNS